MNNKNVYTMHHDHEELQIMNELDCEIIIEGQRCKSYLHISCLADDCDSIDELILDRHQAQFLKAVLDQIL